MRSSHAENLVKKSVTLDEVKLRRVRRLLKATSDSQALRVLIDKELAYRSSVKANQELRDLAPLTPIRWS